MTSHSPRILVVDDEPISLKVLIDALEKEGYQVAQSDSGESAWKQLRDDPAFDIIVLDRLMPGMDGMALLEKLQQDDHLKRIPVIMLTGVDDSDDIIAAISAGVFDYLTKPVNKDQLIDLINKAIH